jgi:hypothetical protein
MNRAASAVPGDAVQQARSLYGGWLVLRGDTIDKVAGVRYLLQAVIMHRLAGRRVAHQVGAVVDGLHAASMYGLAALDPGRRRASLSAAVGATVFAIAELAVARRL